MNCFEHPTAPAVGLCTACGRGVCQACAAGTERALACRDRCEAEARRLLDLRDFWFTEPQEAVQQRRRRRRDSLKGGIIAAVIGGALISLWFVFNEVTFALIGALPFAIGVWEIVRRPPAASADQFRLCPTCGFNLTGNRSGTCPECGSRS